MHSSTLRGTDFALTLEGAPVSHAEFFEGFVRTRRLGVVCPSPLDGLGAAALVMAHVTAFYDDYRAAGGEFFAYPDFFTLQRSPGTANYSMLDIWPNHKNVSIGPAPGDCVDAVTDRAVDVLLVPEGGTGEPELQPVQEAALRRLVRDCYLYGPGGGVDDADLTVSCPRDPVAGWMESVRSSLDGGNGGGSPAEEDGSEVISQSYRRLTLDQALARL